MWSHQSHTFKYLIFYVEFTKWDKIDIKGPLSIEDLKAKMEKDYSITVTMITYGSSTLFSAYGQDSKKRLKMKVH